MGTTSSFLNNIPETIDRECCQTLFGDSYDRHLFDHMFGLDEKISKQSLIDRIEERTDVFLSHNWGENEQGIDNHKRVFQINEQLKKNGLTTWFDEEKLSDTILEQMADGISNSSCFIVFLTKSYLEKVNGKKLDDYCKLEFIYAANKLKTNYIIPVIMEERLKNCFWDGIIGMILSGQKYVDMSGELTDEYLSLKAKELFDLIMKKIHCPISKLKYQFIEKYKNQVVEAPQEPIQGMEAYLESKDFAQKAKIIRPSVPFIGNVYLTKIKDKAKVMKQTSDILICDLFHDCFLGKTDSYEAIKLSANSGNRLAECFLIPISFSGLCTLKDKNRANELAKDCYEWLENSADSNQYAQYILGFCYDNGIFVRKDVSKALELYKLSADQNNYDAQYNLGVIYGDNTWEQQNIDKSMYWFTKSADSGNPVAQFRLAQMYMDGVEKHTPKAFELYKKSAQSGYSEAQNNLGTCYQSGIGSDIDYEEAFKWFKLSAEQGNPQAQCNLGYCYSVGQGVETDYFKSAMWYRRSASQGDAAALNNLGNAYFAGKGVTMNKLEALKLYKLSADQDNPYAQVSLGICYKDGIEIKKDYAEALNWFRKASEKGVPTADYYLGYFYEYGLAIEKDLNVAFSWYKKAAENGSSEAQNSLAFFYRDGITVAIDHDKAIYWYRRSSEGGNPSAQFNLGLIYDKGEWVKKNPDESFKWYLKSAQGGMAQAQTNLGIAYYNGIGTEKSFEEAFKWFEKASQNGSVSSLASLGLCYRNGEGVAKDPIKAFTLFKQAAESNSLLATRYLALSYLNGEGTPQNRPAAIEWLEKGTTLRDPFCQMKLKKLLELSE